MTDKERKKENVILDFDIMIRNSWTYARMTEEERKNWEKVLYSTPTKEALKGAYFQRWHILQAIYSSFLQALNYTPTWRD